MTCHDNSNILLCRLRCLGECQQWRAAVPGLGSLGTIGQLPHTHLRGQGSSQWGTLPCHSPASQGSRSRPLGWPELREGQLPGKGQLHFMGETFPIYISLSFSFLMEFRIFFLNLLKESRFLNVQIWKIDIFSIRSDLFLFIFFGKKNLLSKTLLRQKIFVDPAASHTAGVRESLHSVCS